MEEHYLLGLSLVLSVSFLARWLAWRIHLPSILLLLICGLIAGPGTGYLDPDALFGPLLLPFVSLSVALILFEGGLSLEIRELSEITDWQVPFYVKVGATRTHYDVNFAVTAGADVAVVDGMQGGMAATQAVFI